MMEKDNKYTEKQEQYSNSSGTGVISSMIFMIIALVGMFLLSKYMGN